MNSISGPVVIFDSTCVLCNRSMQFILEKDKNQVLRFTTLNGNYIKNLKVNVQESIPDSIVLYENETLYYESTAALKLSRHLTFPYNLISILIYIPAWLRDPLYRLIAKNRYRWFGKDDKGCYWITDKDRHKFIE